MNFLNQLWQWLALCSVCGGYTGSRGPFCIYCEEQLMARQRSKVLFVRQGLRCRSLFIWEPGDLFMSLVVKVFKERPCNLINTYFARVLTLRLLTSPELSSNHTYLLVPSSRFPESNPLKALVERLPAPIPWQDSFVINAKGVQKKRNRQQRSEKRVALKHPVRRTGRCILLDDVIATGHTAKSVHRVLGEPIDFEVWTLFDRPYRRPIDS